VRRRRQAEPVARRVDGPIPGERAVTAAVARPGDLSAVPDRHRARRAGDPRTGTPGYRRWWHGDGSGFALP